MSLSTESIMVAKLLRRDVEPDEKKIRVRVRTHSDGHTWRGYLFSHEGRHEADPTMAIRAGWAEVEMFPSHLAELERDVAATAPKPAEIERAMHDLRNQIVAIAPDSEVDAMSAPEVLGVLSSGDLRGTTERPYRPAFTVSFQNMNRRELPAILAVERIIDTEPKAAPARR
jgi:hypothetical protein